MTDQSDCNQVPLPKEVLIAGYYGFGNTGDELILTAVLAELRRVFPGAGFIVMSGSPEKTAARHGVRSFLWRNSADMLRAIERSALLVIGGGGLFHDYWGLAPDRILTDANSGLGLFAAIVLWGRLLGKPIFLYGIGAGPLLSGHGRSCVKTIAVLSDGITVRDRESGALLESLGVPPARITLCADPVFGLNPPPGTSAVVEDTLRSLARPLVGIALRHWAVGVDPDYWERQVAEGVQAFLRQSGAIAIFVPMQTETDTRENDLAVARRVAAMIEKGLRATEVAALSPEDTQLLLGHCDLVLGMRMHSLVFAAMAGVPFVSLSYDPKNSSLLAALDMQDFDLPLGTVEAGHLAKLMTRAWESKGSIRNRLSAKRSAMQQAARGIADLAAAVAGQVPGPAWSPELAALAATSIKNQTLALEEMDSKRRLIEAELANAKLSVETQRTKLQATDRESLIAQQGLDEARHNLRLAQTQLAELENAKAAMEASLGEAIRERAGLILARDGDQAQISGLSTELQRVQRERDALRFAREEDQTALRELAHTHSAMETRLSQTEFRLESQLSEKQNRLASIGTDLDAAISRQSQLQNELASTHRAYEQARGNAASSLQTAELENTVLQRRLSELHAWAERQRQHIDELHAWTKAQEDQTANLQVQLDGERGRTRKLLEARLTAKVKRVFHRMLDGMQKLTPEPVRRYVRPVYLPLYRWIFPTGKQVTLVVAGPAHTFPFALKVEPASSYVPQQAAPTAPWHLPAAPQPARRLDVLTFQPKISVVLPVWNHSAFLESSICSVLGQTYANLELIIVDDGSTEDLSPILQRFVEDPRLQVVRRPHEGLPQTLSAGFRRASGSFYTWTSADNLMHPNTIERLVAFLVTHPEVEMVYGDMELIDDSGRQLINSNYRIPAQRAGASNQLALPRNTQTLGTFNDNFIGGCFLYREAAGRIVGNYDGTLLGTEDYDYWLRILLLGNIEHLDSDECLYSYRVHEDSLSGRHGETIGKNASALIAYHRERLVYFRQPFEVLLIGNSRPGPLCEAASLIADELGSSGHSVTLIAVSPGDPGHTAEIRSWMDAARKKTLIICLSPEHAVVAASLPGKNRAVFLWTPPEGFPHPIESDHFDSVWFLCGSAQSVEHLPAKAERNWLLFPVSDLPSRLDPMLAARARDNFWPLWDVPEPAGPVILYIGPMDGRFLNDAAVRSLVIAHPKSSLVFISNSGDSTEAFQDRPPNAHYLGYKDPSCWHQYLSRAALLIAPLSDVAGVEMHAHDMMPVYLASGKPILASRAVANAGYDDAPNTVFTDTSAFAPASAQALRIVPDASIADRYLSRKSPGFLARRITGIANTRLFYRQSRPNAEAPPQARNGFSGHGTPLISKSSGKPSCLLETATLNRGGLEQVVVNMAETLRSRGYRASIAVTRGGGAFSDYCRAKGITVHMTGAEPEAFRKVLEAERTDILIPHFSNVGAPLAWECGVPVLSFIHNSYIWTSSEEDREIARTDLFVSRYVAVSQTAKKYFSGKYRVDPGKIAAIPNGIDVQAFQRSMQSPPGVTRRSLKISADDFVFLQGASIFGIKAQIHAVSAVGALAAKCPKLKLLLAGSLSDPLYETEVKSAIQDLGLAGRVLLLPPAENMTDYYRLADAFMLTSLTEGWSLAKTEAMLFGLPLILTDVGGTREVIHDGDIGIVIPPAYRDIGDVTEANLGSLSTDRTPPNLPALIAAIEDMYRNRDRWKQKAQAGISKVNDSFDYRLIATRHAREIDRVLTWHGCPAHTPLTSSVLAAV